MVCQGARESAANSNAAPKWTTVGVPNAAEPSGEALVGLCAISVTTTNCKPINAPAAEPTMT
jgi:hypothetical protein